MNGKGYASFNELISTATDRFFAPLLVMICGIGLPQINILISRSTSSSIEREISAYFLVAVVATSTINFFPLLVLVISIETPEVDVLAITRIITSV